MTRNPWLDRRVLPWFIATFAVLAFAVWWWVSHQPDITCPPPDHPVWAQILQHGHGQWICGASLTITGNG
jgi:hypothetical protein